MKQATASIVAQTFVDHWIINYGTPEKIRPDSGQKFVTKFFDALCEIMGVKHLTTTAYHTQTNGHTERYVKAIVYHLRHYFADNHPNWDEYVHPLTYA